MTSRRTTFSEGSTVRAAFGDRPGQRDAIGRIGLCLRPKSMTPTALATQWSGRAEAERRRRLPERCPYCGQSQAFHGSAIEPCGFCRRPLIRTITGIVRGRRVPPVALLDAINALQGILVLAVIAALIAGYLSLRTLGQTIAIAMVMAATAQMTDGVLGMHTGVVRLFGKLVLGRKARLASSTKVAAGVVAFVLSLLGIILFAGLG